MKKLSLALFICLFFASLIWLFLCDNIHTVIPQHVYRSSQLSSGSLAYLIELKGIKTVINLRGVNDKPWYRDEIAVTQKLGVKQYDIPLSAYKVISAKDLRELVEILQTAQQPILVHCLGGSDRSALVSALALILDQNTDLKTAEQQFSLRYLVVRSDSTGKITLPYYEKWLQQNHLQSSNENLLAWVKQLKPGENYPCGNNDEGCQKNLD